MRRLILILALLAPLAAMAQPAPYFEVDALNAGLGPPPPGLDRETPQATMESFLSAAEARDWDAAAHLLDLAEFAPEEQPALGPITAEKLAVVLERKVILSWSQLLDRPDALDERAAEQAATAGQARRSLLLGVLDLRDRTVPVRLNRLQPEGGDPVWVFSRQTVENVDALYGLYGPSAFETALPAPLRRDAIWGLAWWEVLGLPIALALALAAGLGTWKLLRAGARRNEESWAGVAFASLKWPLTIAVLTGTLAVMTRHLFVFSGPIDAVLEPLVTAGFVIAVILFAMQALDKVLEQLVSFSPSELADPEKGRTRSIVTAISAIRRIVLVLAVIVGAGLILASAQLFRTLGFSLLASAGALTLILGFAARKVLGNIMASLQIALNRSARIGDQISWDGEWCTVERIHFTFVQLKIWTGNRIVVPVDEFVSKGFESYTLAETELTSTFRITVASTADADAIREVYLDLVQGEDDIVDQDAAKMIVYSQDALGQVLRFQFPSPDPSTGWAIECRLREAVIRAAARMERESGERVLPQGAAADVAA